jgi:hypothetical protein
MLLGVSNETVESTNDIFTIETNNLGVDRHGLLGTARVEFGLSCDLAGIGPQGGGNATEPSARLLYNERFAHDGATASNACQSTTTRRCMAGRCRELAERSWGSFHQKGAHGLRLAKNGVHDCGFAVAVVAIVAASLLVVKKSGVFCSGKS